jgi:hypothetical protein
VRFRVPHARLDQTRRPLGRLASLVALSFLAFLFAHSNTASADSTLCDAGSGAGQCESPEGIAVDNSNGHVYVADKGNRRIDVVDSAGEFLFAFGWGVADGTSAEPQTCTVACFKGIEGSGPGQQVSGETHLAIDTDPASPSYRDLYVAERDNRRVQKFDPTGEFILMLGKGVNKTTGKNICTAESGNVCGEGKAGGGDGEFNRVIMPTVGPGGALFVADTARSGGQEFEAVRVQSFEPSGAFAARLVLLAEPSQQKSFVSDLAGNFYLSFGSDNGSIQKHDSSGALLASYPAHEPTALGANAAGHLFAAEVEGGIRDIAEYSPGGTVLRRFGYGSIEESLGAVVPYHSSSGEIFGAEVAQDRVRYFSVPPPGPIVCCLDATSGNTKATIKGAVNPEGKATTYRIDYVDSASFKSGGFLNPATKSTAVIPVGSDFSLHDLEAQVGCEDPEVPAQPSCLHPDTLYHYRLVATNEDGKSEKEGTFTTRPPLEIKETYATEVGIDSAQLHVTVNPLGIPASGYFEYTTEASYEVDLAQGEGHDGFADGSKAPDVGNGQAPIGFGAGEAPKGGALGIFGLKPGTSYRYRFIADDPFVEVSGPAHTVTTFPVLSPPSNTCSNTVFRNGPSALLPDCRVYEMVSPVDKNGGEIKVLGSTLNSPARLEVSAADGNRFAYSSITSFGDSPSAPWTSEYIATRTEGEGWSTHSINPARETNSLTHTPAFKWDVQYKLFSADLSNGWLIHDTEPPLDECAPAGNLNLYRRDNTTGDYEPLTTAEATDIGKDGYELELQGVSADETRAVIRANGKLTPDAATKGFNQLYEHVQDPEGGCGELRLVSVLPNGKASTMGSSLGTFYGLPGESRENAVNHAVSADGSRVFWSTVGGSGVLYVRDTEAGKTVQIAGSGSQFWDAAADGSKALYSVSAGPELQNLYEFDSAKALAGEPPSTLVAEGFKGVAAASARLSRVYFVSTEALGGEGVTGEPNLYLHEAGGNTSLVASLYGGDETLSRGDLEAFSKFGFAVAQAPKISNGVRTTIDGAHLAFVSAGSLTGYDNLDAADGRHSLEVYLYDLDSDHLACISCNPSGARPAGRLIQSTSGATLRRVSAHMAPGQNQFFAPRTLSADGNRLFFDSFEALLPRDTNGKGDVYEWQRAGSQGECDEVGAELYVPSSGGCLSLISTGQSPSDSEFADASPDGKDVFIRTASSLLPQDPGQVDVYDARIDGGLPQPVAPPAACEGEACQGPLAPPNDPTPASSAFEGAGNVGEAPTRCRKGKVKRKGSCIAKRHSKPKHHKRANDHGRAAR